LSTRPGYHAGMATELAELFLTVLDWFNPKRTIGKVIWGIVLAVVLVVVVIELLAAFGY
jgi:hypothetical protein